jgi:hypothetical protein
VKPDDVLICMIDEWGKGEKEAFDCHITSIRKAGVDVCYLSGYRSRNDFVPWADVVARVDMTRPIIRVADGAFRGHFEVLSHNAVLSGGDRVRHSNTNQTL